MDVGNLRQRRETTALAYIHNRQRVASSKSYQAICSTSLPLWEIRSKQKKTARLIYRKSYDFSLLNFILHTLTKILHCD